MKKIINKNHWTRERITGNFWKASDPKEIVAGAWSGVEEVLAKEYGANRINANAFGKPEDIDAESISRCISSYGGLVELRTEEEFVEQVRKDFQASRADFLRKIERFSYHEGGSEFNLDNIPIVNTVYGHSLNWFYFKDNRRIIEISIFSSKGYHSDSAEFYCGYDSSLCIAHRKREEKFIDKVTDTSSLVVVAEGESNIVSNIKQTYQQARKNLLRG